MTTITTTEPSGISKYIPILGWLPKYKSSWFRLDLVAGLTAAAVIIPQAMAYASIAGLPPEVGLYTALTPMLVYALLGTSRVLSYSITSTIGMLTAAVLVAVAPGGSREELIVAASTLAVLVGALLAVPLTMIVKDVILDGFDSTRGLSDLMSADSPSKPAPDDLVA